MVICLVRDADLHTAQLMPLPLTVSSFSKIQIGFTFLVLAHPGSRGKRPLKVCVRACVRVLCVCVHACVCAVWSIRAWTTTTKCFKVRRSPRRSTVSTRNCGFVVRPLLATYHPAVFSPASARAICLLLSTNRRSAENLSGPRASFPFAVVEISRPTGGHFRAQTRLICPMI